MVLESGAKGLEDHRPVDPGQAADSAEGESERKLDGLELGRHDEEERESLLPPGQDRVQDPDDLDLDNLDRQLQHAGVLALVGVAEDIAATDDDAGIDH